MRKVLLLGGTAEARALADALTALPGVQVVSSLAGRVMDPRLPVGEVRIGGFGGVEGLRDWLAEYNIDAVLDATHPFAARMTANAAGAARAADVPIVHFLRPGWTETAGDHWIRVPDTTAAAGAVGSLGSRVFLTIGRQGVRAFAGLAEAWFLIRAIDPPTDPMPPHHELLLARGPFALVDEQRLLADRRIDMLVTKDSGGPATTAKLTAARLAGIPIVMIDRPALPEDAVTASTVEAAVDWLHAVAW